MRINADFDKPVLLHADDIPWHPSPMTGVFRKPLDRIGAEVARATTIVRYNPGSRFSAHTHDGGEEFIVLDGVFEDEHGAFPAGSYIRNPPTSRHTPGSTDGCVIFVKLWQFDPDDRKQVRSNMTKLEFMADAERPGVETALLFKDERETVSTENWAAETKARIDAPGGAELLILAGSARTGDQTLKPWTWVRRPSGDALDLVAGPDGVRLWLKTGHLDHVALPAA